MIGSVAFTSFLIIALVIMAALFSAIETSFTAYQLPRVHQIKDPAQARAISQLLKNKDMVISTSLILNNIINTLNTIIATGLFIELYGTNLGTLIASAVMTLVIVVFAEALPKGISVSRSEQVVLMTYRPAKLMVKIFSPVNITLNWVLKTFCKMLGIDLTYTISPTEEMRSIIQHHHSEGSVYKEDKDMLSGVLDLSSMHVEDVMTHRSKFYSIDLELPISEIIKLATKSNFSNIPVWKSDKDNIIGVLNVKQMVRHCMSQQYLSSDKQNKDLDLKRFIKEPYFIPMGVALNAQLKEFKQKDSKIAFVLDEYGVIQGMVTMLDILEEITGVMHDSAQGKKIIRKSQSLFLIDGSATLREINRDLGWDLPEGNANTIAGLLINHVGNVPEQGESIELGGLRISVTKKSGNTIKLLEVVVLDEILQTSDLN